ncbi:MAG: hypothetical protein AB8H12_20885 [Lewinella sp.]
MAFTRKDKINGIDLHYARTLAHPYGTRGVKTKFYFEKDFFKTLEKCFKEMFKHCPLGKPEVITTAGVFVNRAGSQHRHGTAFDFDGAFWEDYTMMTTNFMVDFELYLGIESFLRRHFGIVLNYLYNEGHKDHWHIDDSVGVAFSKNSRSKMLYLQATLSYIYQEEVVVDGLFGPQTQGAFNRVATKLGIRTGNPARDWLTYLELTGKVAFKLFESNKAPVRLLNNVYELVGDLPLSNRVALAEALNSFRYHPTTDSWLGGLGDDDDRLAAAIDAVV